MNYNKSILIFKILPIMPILLKNHNQLLSITKRNVLELKKGFCQQWDFNYKGIFIKQILY